MKLLIILFFCGFLLCNCDNAVNGGKTESKASAGEDQETYVGSYVEFDISQSIINEEIASIEWRQDANNPKEISLYAPSLYEKSIAGFEIDGIYKLVLEISCKNGNIYTDSVTILVRPRQNGLINDIYLETRIRHRLNFKEGELNFNKLLELDSLTNSGFGLKNYKTKNLNGIEYCTNLKSLTLSNESITNLTPISQLTKLEFLNLNQNRTIEDITPLYNLASLKTLILYSNPIKEISGLGNLTKITYLDILDIPINDITPLSKLVHLETLYASGVGVNAKFNSIDPLKNLTELKILDIAGRGITDIKPIENLAQLNLLEVSYNKISEIAPVYKMTKLVRLYIRQNEVIDISGIKNLESLDFFDAADNKIKDISELEYLPKIHLIGLSGNNIEDISPLINNPYLGSGVYLYLGNNPLNEKSINEYVPELIRRGVTVYTNL